jgi:tellurite resistance protein
MGLFDRVKGVKEAENIKLTKEESFASISLAAIAADGMITEEEAQGMILGLVRMKMFAGYNPNQMSAMMNKLVGIVRKQGLDSLLNMAKEGLSPDMRETAFAVATDLALADGEIAAKEKEILTKMQQDLGIPEDKAVNIIEVLLIKNKG